MTLLEAIRECLVSDPHGWQETVFETSRGFTHAKTRTQIILYRNGVIAVNHRVLWWWDRLRLRRALDERIARIITDHLLDAAIDTMTAKRELT